MSIDVRAWQWQATMNWSSVYTNHKGLFIICNKSNTGSLYNLETSQEGWLLTIYKQS